MEPVAAKAADVARKSRRFEVERCIARYLSNVSGLNSLRAESSDPLVGPKANAGFRDAIRHERREERQ
jgi:hypothetical protein